MINFLIRQGCSASSGAPAGATTTRITRAATPPGRAVEGISVQCRQVGQLERQGSATAGQGLRIRGADQRAALGTVFSKPCAKGPSRWRRGYSCAAQRRVSRGRQILTNGSSLIAQMLKSMIDLSDGEATAVDERRNGRSSSSRRAGFVGRARRSATGRAAECRGRAGEFCWPRADSGITPTCGRPLHSGNQPNEAKWSIANRPATHRARYCRRRWGLGAKKPTLLDEAWLACLRCSSPTVGTNRGIAGLGTTATPAPSTSISAGPTFFATSRTLTSRVGKAMYANKAVAVLDGLRRRLRAQVCGRRETRSKRRCRSS